MSFSVRKIKKFQINIHLKILINKILKRYSIRPIKNSKKRTSFDFFKGSLTLETIIVLPLFLCAILSLLSVALLFLTEMKVQDGLMEAAQELSWRSEKTEDFADKEKIQWYTLAKLAGFLGENAISHPVISSGLAGIDVRKSEFVQDRQQIHLVAEYTVELPISLLGIRKYPVRQEVVTRAWVGSEWSEENEDTEYVYITEKGTVYHLTKACTYLTRDIETVLYFQLKDLRNENGGIYYPCQSCMKGMELETEKDRRLYITKYGDRYHINKGCSTLKRYIKTVEKKEIEGERKACSVCGEEE